MDQSYLVLPIMLCSGYLTSRYAARKQRNSKVWFGLGFFFFLIAPAILMFLPESQSMASSQSMPIEPTLEPIPEPTPQDWYYLDSDHKQIGPLSFTSFKDAYTSGHFTKESYIWNDLMDEWKELHTQTLLLSKLDVSEAE